MSRMNIFTANIINKSNHKHNITNKQNINITNGQNINITNE